MAIDIKPILNAGVAAQAASLAGSNLYGLKKKPSTKRLLKSGMTNIAGVSLLQAQSQVIGGL